jgi:hypothetical protein
MFVGVFGFGFLNYKATTGSIILWKSLTVNAKTKTGLRPATLFLWWV